MLEAVLAFKPFLCVQCNFFWEKLAFKFIHILFRKLFDVDKNENNFFRDMQLEESWQS